MNYSRELSSGRPNAPRAGSCEDSLRSRELLTIERSCVKLAIDRERALGAIQGDVCRAIALF
jgi:hypothetical protein